MICPRPVCRYEWMPRKTAPVSCPRCKARLDILRRPVPLAQNPLPQPPLLHGEAEAPQNGTDAALIPEVKP